MYYWNLKALKKDLARGPLPAKEAAKYYGLALLGAFMAGFPGFWPVRVEPATLVGLLLAAGLCGWGLWRAYHVNGGNGGSDFLARMTALQWVCACRFTLLNFPLLLLGFLVLFLGGSLLMTRRGSLDPGATSTDLAIELFLLLTVVLYWRGLHRHLAEVVRASSVSEGIAQ